MEGAGGGAGRGEAEKPMSGDWAGQAMGAGGKRGNQGFPRVAQHKDNPFFPTQSQERSTLVWLKGFVIRNKGRVITHTTTHSHTLPPRLPGASGHVQDD